MVLILIGLFVFLPQPSESTPEQELSAAWSAANAADSFEFETNLEQTTHPAPSLANVGRSSRTESMYMKGSVDRRAQEMRLTLARDALAGPGEALEVRVRNGVSEGRVSGGAWQKVDTGMDTLAPGGDMLAVVDAAMNVTRTAQSFSFDIDGAKLSDRIRDDLAKQMRQRGELPPGVSVDTPLALRGALGSAQVWLDDVGYPARMKTELTLPAQKNGERSVVRFSTRFDNYQGGPATALFGMTLPGRLQALRRQVGSPEGIAAAGTLALTAVLGIAFAAMMNAARRSRRMRTAMIGMVIATMTGGPLLQTQLVYAANERTQARTVQQKSAEKSRVAADAVKASLTSNTWAPNADPLADAVSPEEPVAAPVAVDEPLPMVAARSASEVTSVDNSDADGDGLTATQEERLGTDPNAADTDGDFIPDGTEVAGFAYNGRTWYTDPTALDTNNDGRTDASECAARIQSNTAACSDTDGDGIPDAFDDDDDNDGVRDDVDVSPLRVMGANGTGSGTRQPFNANHPLQLGIDNLQVDPATGAGYRTFVDFQLRPLTTSHLTQEFNVFDWPSGDDPTIGHRLSHRADEHRIFDLLSGRRRAQ